MQVPTPEAPEVAVLPDKSSRATEPRVEAPVKQVKRVTFDESPPEMRATEKPAKLKRPKTKQETAQLEPVKADPTPSRSGRERKLSQKAAEWKESGDKLASKLKTVLLCAEPGGEVIECGLNMTVEESLRSSSS